MSNASLALIIGRTLAGKYAIEALVGTGGMGAVYRARQIALDKAVAIKVLHRELAAEPKFIERFKREAFSASQLDHPNSLRVLDFGEDGGLLYLAMEYLEAEDLLSVMNREWPLSDERIVRILSQVLAALAVAHDLSIVHRDLKPENILVVRRPDDEGELTDLVKVCDFGVAKVTPHPNLQPNFARHLTVDGLAIGTPDYMSPEQARGEPVDGRSDLYSVGVVLYHLLIGRPPFTGDSALGVALQHVSDQPVAPSRLRDVHPGLEAICMRALSKRPDERFATAREMRRALRSALEGAPSAAHSIAPVVIPRPPTPTPHFGSPTGTLVPARADLFVRPKRRLRVRYRQAAWAGAVGAMLGVVILASLPPGRQLIERQLRKRFELVQTVAAAHLDAASTDLVVHTDVDTTAVVAPAADLLDDDAARPNGEARSSGEARSNGEGGPNGDARPNGEVRPNVEENLGSVAHEAVRLPEIVVPAPKPRRLSPPAAKTPKFVDPMALASSLNSVATPPLAPPTELPPSLLPGTPVSAPAVAKPVRLQNPATATP